MSDLTLSVGEALDLINVTLDAAYPFILIEGEVASFNVNRQKYIFFDIKDETASLSCFMMVFQLKFPIEDGMRVRVLAQPKLTKWGKFSLTIREVMPVGEGSLKKSFEILKNKLESEGLFAVDRKRALPFAPARIGLIASGESAAYGDFIKIVNTRWGGVRIVHRDVQVQGAKAEADIVQAIKDINQLDDLPEVIVVTRGGGSLEDLAAFNTESVARAVATSRVPIIVAVGHEQDVSLAELAADQRASTPSNAAELLVPDKKQILTNLKNVRVSLFNNMKSRVSQHIEFSHLRYLEVENLLANTLASAEQKLKNSKSLLLALNPEAALKKGYAIIRSQQGIINSAKKLHKNDQITLKFYDGGARATINEVQ